MDHQPLAIVQQKDSEGFSLHGGPVYDCEGEGRFNPELQYRFVNGMMWTSLLAASIQLSDHNRGDGGFCVVRGSHKLNLPVPTEIANGLSDEFKEHLHQPVTQAGDVILWSEATVHGATPWLGQHERRLVLYRFAPANMGYGRGYLEIPPDALESFTPMQRAVVEPPYSTRLERPILTNDIALEPDMLPMKITRTQAKKDHDRNLFGTEYF